MFSSVDQPSLSSQPQYALTPRTYVYGQIDYLRDLFKLIDYLVALPLASASSGTPSGRSSRSTASVRSGRRIRTSTASTPASPSPPGRSSSTSSRRRHPWKHAATALWKADDLADGLYTISIGLGLQDLRAAAVHRRSARHLQESFADRGTDKTTSPS